MEFLHQFPSYLKNKIQSFPYIRDQVQCRIQETEVRDQAAVPLVRLTINDMIFDFVFVPLPHKFFFQKFLPSPLPRVIFFSNLVFGSKETKSIYKSIGQCFLSKYSIYFYCFHVERYDFK